MHFNIIEPTSGVALHKFVLCQNLMILLGSILVLREQNLLVRLARQCLLFTAELSFIILFEIHLSRFQVFTD
jgi:hypothetical protein